MVGIPVYAPEAGLHDFVVQATGAFEETIHGILNLAALGQRVEIRIVIQKHTVPVLHDLAVSSSGTCRSSTRSPSWDWK